MLRKFTACAFLIAMLMSTVACEMGPGSVQAISEADRPKIGDDQFDPTDSSGKPSNDPNAKGGKTGVVK